MVVWSDRAIQKLAREFVCCTEEVDILFPRNKWALNHLKDDPAVKLFRDTYGPQIPREHWNPDPEMTKQGVYAFMPDGTYLSARFVGVRRDQVIEFLQEALTKWKEIRQEKNLKPKPVPQHKALSKWREAKSKELGLLMELHYRDLPRVRKKAGNGKTVGEHHNTTWVEFTKAQAADLIPVSNKWAEVSDEVRNHFFCKGLKDIVYGQSPNWQAEDVKSGKLMVRRIGNENGMIRIRLRGDFDLKDESHQFTGKLIGEMTWSEKEGRVLRMSGVALGQRRGGTTYNFRNADEDPAPLGVSFAVRRSHEARE